jgi:DNA-binding NarL/FixJ family response regulator
VGRAADIATLFEAVSRLRPDVVLLDLSLPGDENALDACRRLAGMTPPVRIVVFTAHDDPFLRRLFLAAGAAAFVSKLDAAPTLAATIQAVVDGTAADAG